MGVHTAIANRIARAVTKNTVCDGIFRGMRYQNAIAGSTVAPKLFGSYEKEIASALTSALRQKPDFVVNVGAGEGYYAVGIARLVPRVRVIAFETRPAGQRNINILAKLNQVDDQITVFGRATTIELARAIENVERGLLLMDIEGGEHELLDPNKIARLKQMTILVETHPDAVVSLEVVIRERFAATHGIQIFQPQERSVRDVPFRIEGVKRLVPRTIWKKMVDEKRGSPTPWLFMVPR